MKRFRFRLETALRIRRMTEQQAQAGLAEAERGVVAAEHALTLLLEERERHLTYYARIQEAHTPDIALITATCCYTEILDENLETQRQAVRAAIALRETRREALVRAQQDHETLERLKEKKHQEHQLEEAAQEQAWMDEVAVLRFGRT